MTLAVELTELVKVYGSGARRITAVDGLSLGVEEGEFVSLVGPSGCGKSTLLRMVGGLLRPTQGEARVRGRIAAPPCAFVFQENDLLPWRRARENVVLGMPRNGEAPAAARQRADEALRLVGLGGFADRFPGELSVGMRRRVSLARAFASGHDLLLMDEPFAAVDAQARHRLQNDLLELCASRRPTVVFVTHDVAEAVRLGDRVVVLSPRPARVVADLRGAHEREVWDLLAETP